MGSSTTTEKYLLLYRNLRDCKVKHDDPDGREKTLTDSFIVLERMNKSCWTNYSLSD